MYAASEMTVSIREALRNDDVRRLAEGRIMENFAFETGAGYVDKAFLEKDWKDTVANAVDVKNTMLFLAPGAQLGVIGRTGIATTSGLTAQTTVIGTMLSGASKIGTVTMGAERLAGLGETASGIRQTIASTRAMQALGTELNTGVRLIDGSFSLGSKLAIEESIETGAGYVVQTLVNTFAPDYGQTLGFLTETITGQSNILDVASEGIEQAGKAIARDSARKLVLDTRGNVLGEIPAMFTTREERDAYITGIEKLAKDEGKEFANIGNGAFRIEGKTYLAAIEGEALPNIEGVPAAAIATVSPAAIKKAIEQKAEEARKAVLEARKPMADDEKQRLAKIIAERPDSPEGREAHQQLFPKIPSREEFIQAKLEERTRIAEIEYQKALKDEAELSRIWTENPDSEEGKDALRKLILLNTGEYTPRGQEDLDMLYDKMLAERTRRADLVYQLETGIQPSGAAKVADRLQQQGADLGSDPKETINNLAALERQQLPETPGHAFAYHNTRPKNINDITETGLKPTSSLNNYRSEGDIAFDSRAEASLPERFRGKGYSRQDSVYAHPTTRDTADQPLDLSVKIKVEVDPDTAIVTSSQFYTDGANKVMGGESDVAARIINSYWRDTVSLRDFNRYYTIDPTHATLPPELDSLGSTYFLDTAKAAEANLHYELPDKIYGPEVLIPGEIPLNRMQVVGYGQEIKQALPEGSTSIQDAIKKVEVEGSVPCPVLVAAAAGVCDIAPPSLFDLPHRVDEPELADAGQLDLRVQNAPSPTQQQIEEGKILLAKIAAFKQAKPGSDEFAALADDLYRQVTTDKYGALKLPEFAWRIQELEKYSTRYHLIEVSMPRETLKRLNDQGYELGSAAIDQQHRSLVDAVRQHDGIPTTLQKTTYVACTTQQCIDAVLQQAKQTEQRLSELAGEPVTLQIGIARGRDDIMQTRLHTRRSMKYSAEHQTPPTEYDNGVKAWYDSLPIERQAEANDIFHGFERTLRNDYYDLAGLRTEDRLGYQDLLIRLAKMDTQDRFFSSLPVVKAYQADQITGIKEGDIVVAIDGIGVGQKNKESILRITKEEIERGEGDLFLGLKAGNKIDHDIANVNKKIRDVYDEAVDNIKMQPAETIQKYRIIAQGAGYDGSIDSLDDLKVFLKWEFAQRGRFRGGDETFMTFRREVLDANPTLAQDLPNKIRNCGKPCGYDIRVGVKEAAAGEKYSDVLENADSAVLLSKKNNNDPITIAKDGTITGTRQPLAMNPELERFRQLVRLKQPAYAAQEAEKLEGILESLTAKGKLDQAAVVAERVEILRERAAGTGVDMEDILSSDVGESAVAYLHSRGIPEEEAARLIAQADISNQVSRALTLRQANQPQLKQVVQSDRQKLETFQQHLHRYIGRNVQTRRVLQGLDADATSISYVVRGTPGEIDSIRTISLNNDGQFVIEHYPLEQPTPAGLEETIHQANRQLRNAEEAEQQLVSLYKERELPIEQRQSGLDDDDLETAIQQAIDEHRHVMAIEAAENYRHITAGKDSELSGVIFINENHLKAVQDAVDLVKQDIHAIPPDIIIYSGRGGYPYEESIINSFPTVESTRIFSNSVNPEPGQAYAELNAKLDLAIAARQTGRGTGTVRVALIEGAEFSGASVRNIRNSLKQFQRQDSKETKLEVIIYTFRQNQEASHFENMGRLTTAPQNEELATSFVIPEQNLEVIHKRVDVPFVIGEDKAMMLGQLPDKTIVQSHAPLVVFNEHGVVTIVDPGLESTTAEAFSGMLN